MPREREHFQPALACKERVPPRETMGPNPGKNRIPQRRRRAGAGALEDQAPRQQVGGAFRSPIRPLPNLLQRLKEVDAPRAPGFASHACPIPLPPHGLLHRKTGTGGERLREAASPRPCPALKADARAKASPGKELCGHV